LPENTQLFDDVRLAARRLADEDRKQQETQRSWQDLADEYHHEIRKAVEEVGRKAIATDLGVDLSTVSNWISCEVGRGFPPPRLLIYLRKRSPSLIAWESDRAGYVPPTPKEAAIDEAQALVEIEHHVLGELGKRDSEKVRSILRRVRRRGAP
jgi:hypothetical protein